MYRQAHSRSGRGGRNSRPLGCRRRFPAEPIAITIQGLGRSLHDNYFAKLVYCYWRTRTGTLQFRRSGHLYCENFPTNTR